MSQKSLLGAFLDQATRTPDAPALVWHGERIGYGRLLAMASAAHARVRALGLPRDLPVGLFAKKSPRAIALILGCLMARHRFLLPSVELGETALGALFAQAGCSRILSPDAATAAVGALDIERISCEAEETADTAPADPTEPGDIAFMLTTSGSTGLPKIVPLSMAAVDAFTGWAAATFDIGPGKTVLNYAPLNFDLCFLDIWTTLAHGGCVALVDQDQATNPAYLLDLLTGNDVHVIQAVPMLYRLLIDATQADGRRFDGVEHAIFTGDSMPTASLLAMPRLFGRARFHNIYGCTETNDSFIHEVALPDGALPGPLPIGRPLPGVDVLILGEDGAEIEGPGAGELLVSTPFQTAGYLDHALNDGKFSSRPRGGTPVTYFHSGDIVRRHGDGTVTIEGRKDFHVKIRGVRVNTQEIEQIILEHDLVLNAAVVAVPDETAGNRLHAVVQRKPASALNSLNLRQHCAQRLVRAAIPSTIEIVETALPKTSTGKVDRKQILKTQMTGERYAS